MGKLTNNSKPLDFSVRNTKERRSRRDCVTTSIKDMRRLGRGGGGEAVAVLGDRQPQLPPTNSLTLLRCQSEVTPILTEEEVSCPTLLSTEVEGLGLQPGPLVIMAGSPRPRPAQDQVNRLWGGGVSDSHYPDCFLRPRTDVHTEAPQAP